MVGGLGNPHSICSVARGVRACVPKGRHLCARKRALYALPAMSVYRSRGVLSVRKRTSCRDGVMYGVFRGLADCGVLLVRGESRGDSTELEGSLGSFFCASMLDTARGTARSRGLRGGLAARASPSMLVVALTAFLRCRSRP